MKDTAAEKAVEAKDAIVETMEEVGEQAMHAGSATWRFAQANALPLALFAGGAAWLVANNRRTRDRGWQSESPSELARRPTQPDNRRSQRGGTSKSVPARWSSRARF